MNRQQKEEVIKQLQHDFSESQASFLVDYRGLSVEQMQKLRKELHKQGGSLKVAKVRLMKRAVENTDSAELLTPYLKDQLALVFSKEEPPAVAKVLYDFAKENEQLQMVAGCLDSELLTKEAISDIAKLPSKEVLYAKLCGTLKAPAAGLVNVLNQHVIQLLMILKQIGEQKK